MLKKSIVLAAVLVGLGGLAKLFLKLKTES